MVQSPQENRVSGTQAPETELALGVAHPLSHSPAEQRWTTEPRYRGSATYRPHSSSFHSRRLGLPAHGVPVRRAPAGRAVQWMAGDSIVQSLVGTLLFHVAVKIDDQFSHCFLHITWRGVRRQESRWEDSTVLDFPPQEQPKAPSATWTWPTLT